MGIIVEIQSLHNDWKTAVTPYTTAEPQRENRLAESWRFYVAHLPGAAKGKGSPRGLPLVVSLICCLAGTLPYGR
jgi:hypothetical protein